LNIHEDIFTLLSLIIELPILKIQSSVILIGIIQILTCVLLNFFSLEDEFITW